MVRLVGAAVVLLLALVAGASLAPARARTVDGLNLGHLELIEPEGEPRGLVFLLSDADGLTPGLEAAATKLAGELGVIVAPVDLPGSLRRLEAEAESDGSECLYLVGDIEEASQRIQAQGKRERYLTPIVAGTGAGAAVAYVALAQSPDATIDGAASDGFSTRIVTQKPFCGEAPPHPAAEGGFAYGPSERPLPGWWRVAVPPEDATAARSFAAAVASNQEKTVLEASAGSDLAARLVLLLRPPVEAAQAESQTVADLPLVELPVAGKGRYMAVIYSGDGGWRDIDKDIAGRLQASGIPVVGVDSLRYFWSAKTPEQVGSDLALILDHYREAWGRPDVVLAGYSFGADILPFAYNRLPPDQKQHVRRLSLLGVSSSADFEIHVTGWLGVNEHEGSLPTLPELRAIPHGLIQCFYGEEEEDPVCARPELADTQLVKTGGGHHFDGNYEKLADEILAGLPQRP
ncbi:virulence factor family protein [Benzoatithermus flavus]|uniref:AcvB/VirJ family lysyl-phosphatidylglycerol hydrolase n=1 Tax=Benzoatithermus flavus TaxID=3108223 RepID=A0ABU8XMT9_9PROT